MSQEIVLTILSSFGPLRSVEIQRALGQGQTAIYSSLKRLRKQGAVSYMVGRGRAGRESGMSWANPRPDRESAAAAFWYWQYESHAYPLLEEVDGYEFYARP